MRDNERKINVKYPIIKKILEKLYVSAYSAGLSNELITSDGYDHSTAYEEIEKALKDDK